MENKDTNLNENIEKDNLLTYEESEVLNQIIANAKIKYLMDNILTNALFETLKQKLILLNLSEDFKINVNFIVNLLGSIEQKSKYKNICEILNIYYSSCLVNNKKNYINIENYVFPCNLKSNLANSLICNCFALEIVNLIDEKEVFKTLIFGKIDEILEQNYSKESLIKIDEYIFNFSKGYEEYSISNCEQIIIEGYFLKALNNVKDYETCKQIEYKYNFIIKNKVNGVNDNYLQNIENIIVKKLDKEYSLIEFNNSFLNKIKIFFANIKINAKKAFGKAS